MMHYFYLMVISCLVFSPTSFAEKKKTDKTSKTATKTAAKKETKKAFVPKTRGKKKRKKKKEESLSTNLDFEETSLEGKMKVPSGMMLKGRVQQNKSQMVQLRKNFRPGLRKSRAAVRTIKPKN